MPALSDFQGNWRLDRVIEDARGGVAQLIGQARFVADGAALWLIEEGELHLNDQSFRATRRYLWRQGETGIEVDFDDGRFFHGIEAGDAPVAGHDCGADRYDVTYDFAGFPSEWRSLWQVTGPRKDYVMRSVYRRETAFAPWPAAG